VGGSSPTDPLADGPALAERFDGHAWTALPVPAGTAGLSPLTCMTATSCTAVAFALDGSTWSSSGGFGHKADIVTGLSCASATSCLTVGFRGPLGSRFQYEYPVLGAVSCPTGGPCVAVGARAISRTEARALAGTG
jgi:hypothetical protein